MRLKYIFYYTYLKINGAPASLVPPRAASMLAGTAHYGVLSNISLTREGETLFTPVLHTNLTGVQPPDVLNRVI